MDSFPRILIIDDRHSEVWFMERVLKKLGFEVDSAFDGEEGLKKLAEQVPDLIILDTIMPRMDGYKVYTSLSADRNFSEVPVLMLTDKGEAYERSRLSQTARKSATLSSRKRVSENPPNPLFFINKPIKPDDLADRVQCLFDMSLPAVESPPQASRPRVLVIDDDVSLVRQVSDTLRAEGIEVIQAYDGLSGLNKVKEEKPDLIVLDTIMPQLNGLQVLRYLRQHYTIPVLMIPGESEADLLSRALISGAESYLIKPLDLRYLSTFVRRKLKLPALDMA